MSILTYPSATVEATTSTGTPGLTGTIGVRVVDGVGATTIARATSGIVESPADSGIYTATFTAPGLNGSYLVVWDTGTVAPDTVSSETLIVGSPPSATTPIGAPFEAYLQGAPTGLVGSLGVRIVDGQGATTTARDTSGIVETPAGSGIYAATLQAPAVAGTYSVIWDSAGGTPVYANDTLVVSATTVGATDLTTLDAVRAFLQKEATDTGQDPAIQTLITAASDLINHHIARFRPAETAATKTFTWTGGPLSLHPYFLRSATAIQTGTENGASVSGTSTLAASDYRLRPQPSPRGVYRWIRFPGWTTTVYGCELEVTVTGDWGFAGFSTVPDDVKHWTNVTVATWLRRDVSAFSTTLRLEEDRLERPDILPTAAVRGLARYTRGGF